MDSCFLAVLKSSEHGQECLCYLGGARLRLFCRELRMKELRMKKLCMELIVEIRSAL